MNKMFKLSFCIFWVLTFCNFVIAGSVSIKDRLSNEAVKVPGFDFSFKKPNQWITRNEKAMLSNLEKLNKEKEKIADLLGTHQGMITIASYAKQDPAKVNGPIPTINILVRKMPSRDFLSFKQMVQNDIKKFSKILNNYKWLQPLQEKNVAGRRALVFISQFEFNTSDGKAYPIKNITYAIPIKDAFIQVSMSEKIPTKNQILFEAFIQSFSFD